MIYDAQRVWVVETIHIIKEKNKVKDEVNENAERVYLASSTVLARKFSQFLKVNQLDHANLGLSNRKERDSPRKSNVMADKSVKIQA